jgi:hypothetical protein
MSTASVAALSLLVLSSFIFMLSSWGRKIKTLWWNAGDKWLDPAGSRSVFFLYNGNFYDKETLRG